MLNIIWSFWNKITIQICNFTWKVYQLIY